MAIKNTIKNINSECQVVFFNWANAQARKDLNLLELTDSEPIDISKYLIECSFTKSMSAPSGTFEITLPNDRDWKDILKRGTWGLIYMSQEGKLSIPKGTDVPDINELQAQGRKLRGIVYIERVTAKGTIGSEAGEFSVEFVVSGRDFGIVYEENEIFYNLLYSEGKIQEAAAGELRTAKTRNTTELLKILHKAFFSPQELNITLEGDSIQKAIPLQWALPTKLMYALNVASTNNRPYYGSIDGLFENFEKTLCSFPVENPLTLINGKAWERLKSHSIEQFHELFPETNSDGQPRLNFRYIPWKISDGKTLGKLNPLVKAFKDVKRVSIGPIDILEWDLGEDTHSLYNYFLTVVDTSLFTVQSSVATLRDTDPTTGFPRIFKNNIRRNGLKLMYSTVNALIQLGSEEADQELLNLHNELMLEYWANSSFMESGSMTIVGNNETKIGKVLAIETNAPYNGGKLFYIEGYSDRFISEENGAGFWTQSLTLTRGIFPGKTDERGEDYTDKGEFTENK